MNIRHILGTAVPPEAEDAVDMILSERFQKLTDRKSREQREEAARIGKQVTEMVKEHYDGRCGEGERFLDELLACQCGDVEDAYLYGIKDGIRIAKNDPDSIEIGRAHV